MIIISLLIPSISKNSDNTEFKEIFLKSFLKFSDLTTYYFYIYLGYDYNDNYYSENKVNYLIDNKSCELIYVKLPPETNSLVKKWNYLLEIAILNNPNCYFFYQLGDDINFIDNGWETEFIYNLSKTNFIGITGPKDLNNSRLLTQIFFSKRHWDIFGYLFNREINNWYSDNWINEIYKHKYLHFSNSRIDNTSKLDCRYSPIIINQNKLSNLIDLGKNKINEYINNLIFFQVNLNYLENEFFLKELSNAYIFSKQNNYELIIKRNNNLLIGFNNFLNKKCFEKNIKLQKLGISEINTLKNEIYQFVSPYKIYLNNNNLFCAIWDNQIDINELKIFILNYLNKWNNICKIYWYSNLEPCIDFTNLFIVNNEDKLKECNYVIYTINLKYIYELLIKFKPNYIIEIKTKNIKYLDYYINNRPFSFDINKKLQRPKNLLIPIEHPNIFKFIGYNIYFYNIDFLIEIKKIMLTETHCLILKHNIENIPYLDFSYPFGIDLNNNQYIFINNKNITELFYRFSLNKIIENIPVYFIE
jgi:hypothetical protein